MLDIAFIRSNPDLVREAIRNRGMDLDISPILEADKRRRDLLYQTEQKKAVLNATSKQISELKKAGEDASDKIAAMRELSDEIKEAQKKIREVEQQLQALLLEVPNIPDPSVPVGTDETDNIVIRTVGKPRDFGFEPLPHWEIGEKLGILDFPSAARIAGARFVVGRRAGAALERALVNFMLDVHTREHGYTEILPPFLANARSLIGTGNLPKFEQDMFKTREGFYLIPTAEVPLTNLHQDEILDGDLLPLYYTAYSPCWRAEAGAAGQESRGIIRQHQFNKVELMKFTRPEDAPVELEALLHDAEDILTRLELPYRVVSLCTGDITFASAKTYDIEVHFPGMGRYVEVSSCSMYGEFQARRANTRYRPDPESKPKFVHTMNGSGLAAGRTLAALLENYQRNDGTVAIPEALRPYMGGVEAIDAPIGGMDQ